MDTQVLLGIDYGTSKIGLALGRNGLTMPLSEVNGRDEMSSIHQITRIILENKVSKIIMGLPVMGDGKDTPQARKVRRYSKLLKVVSKKPLDFINEYRTTQESLQEGTEKKLLGKNKQEDSLAAALILKRYYNEK